MEVITSVAEITHKLEEIRRRNETIGFIPTMGALHKGHISLIDKARSETDFCVVSIFVNPRQFNDKNDFEKYPRNLNNDLNEIENAGCDLVFTPEYIDLFPTEEKLDFDFEGLDEILEAAFRPGHFQGVVDVVQALFKVICPDNAYFGLKDYQQLKIIQLLAAKYHPEIHIIPCPIIRESDGLAMSSRNMRLTPSARKTAANISDILFKASEISCSYSSGEIKRYVTEKFAQIPELQLEYAEICNPDNLKTIDTSVAAKGNLLLVAIWCDKIRLIDNIYLNS